MLEKCAKISSVIQGIAALVFLYSYFFPSLKPTGPHTSAGSQPTWLLTASIAFLALSVITSSVLNLLALRGHTQATQSGKATIMERIDETQKTIPSILVNNTPVAGPAKIEADEKLPKIVKLSDQVSYTGGMGFPLKLHMQLRNDSSEAVDVQLKEYIPKLITTKGLPLEVLQIRIGGTWQAQPQGVSRIAVFPEQQFQAWIGLDEGKFNKGQIEEHRGNIGTLVLFVNGHDVRIPL